MNWYFYKSGISLFQPICPSYSGQGRGSAAGLPGAGGCAGESRRPVPVLWYGEPDRQALLQHEGLSPHLLKQTQTQRSPWRRASVASLRATSDSRPAQLLCSSFVQLWCLTNISAGICLYNCSYCPPPVPFWACCCCCLCVPESVPSESWCMVSSNMCNVFDPLFSSLSCPPTALCAKE